MNKGQLITSLSLVGNCPVAGFRPASELRRPIRRSPGICEVKPQTPPLLPKIPHDSHSNPSGAAEVQIGCPTLGPDFLSEVFCMRHMARGRMKMCFRSFAMLRFGRMKSCDRTLQCFDVECQLSIHQRLTRTDIHGCTFWPLAPAVGRRFHVHNLSRMQHRQHVSR